MLKEIGLYSPPDAIRDTNTNQGGSLDGPWMDDTRFNYSSARGFSRLEQLQPFDEALVATVQGWVNSDWQFNHARVKTHDIKKSLILIFKNASCPNGDNPELMKVFRPDYLKLLEDGDTESKGTGVLMLNRLMGDVQVSVPTFPVARSSIFAHLEQVDNGQGVLCIGFDLPNTYQFGHIDRDVINAAINGDKDAFGQIYTVFWTRVFHYVSGMLYGGGAKNYLEDAEDITQEVFESGFKAMRRFKVYEGVPLSAWFLKIATNKTTSFFRRASSRPLTMGDEGLEKKPYSLDEDTLLELMVVASRVRDISPRQQQILALTSLGYKDFENAWILGLTSVANLKVQKYKGRVKLKGASGYFRDRLISQMYLVILTEQVLLARLSRGKKPGEDGDLKKGVISVLKRRNFQKYHIDEALAELPEDFFEKLAAVHSIPRENRVCDPFASDPDDIPIVG